MMANYIKRLEATAIHGRFDVAIDLNPGVNIVYGKNGAGKTSLIHILANALNGEYHRFAYFVFDSIKIRFDNATLSLSMQDRDGIEYIIVKRGNKIIQRIPIEIIKSDPKRRKRITARQYKLFKEGDLTPRELDRLFTEIEDIGEDEPILPAAYFPAFRTMIDAWAFAHQEQEKSREPERWTIPATRSARRWFGQFIPSINYPSLLEIEERLSDEIHKARLIIGRADREYLSEAFLDIFATLSEDEEQELEPEVILTEIRELFDRLEESPLQEESTLVTRVYSELRESIQELDLAQESERTAIRVLGIYRDLLQRIVDVQEQSFEGIQRYLESVNGFLDNKRLIIDLSVPRYRRGIVGIGFDDQTKTRGLRALSSGERQIATMIYAATHMSEQQVVLIDEPEISLHVDWQRDLLHKMSEQIGKRQIIACTHSPVIGADYEDNQTEIKLKPTRTIKVPREDSDFDIETIF